MFRQGEYEYGTNDIAVRPIGDDPFIRIPLLRPSFYQSRVQLAHSDRLQALMCAEAFDAMIFFHIVVRPDSISHVLKKMFPIPFDEKWTVLNDDHVTNIRHTALSIWKRLVVPDGPYSALQALWKIDAWLRQACIPFSLFSLFDLLDVWLILAPVLAHSEDFMILSGELFIRNSRLPPVNVLTPLPDRILHLWYQHCVASSAKKAFESEEYASIALRLKPGHQQQQRQ